MSHGNSLNICSGLKSCKQAEAPAALRNYPFAYRIKDELGGIVQIQFLQDVTAVGLDGIGANVERRSYFLIRFPFNQKLQDLPLAAGKQVIRVHRAFLLKIANIVFRQDMAYLRAKKATCFAKPRG